MNKKKRLIIGISGATGAIYGVRMLEILSKIGDIETHLVLSKAGKMTIQVETPYSVKDVESMADVAHDINNVGASISSGSFRTEGMVIAPCSMKSMGGIAHSLGGDLLVRAADVVLKERKKLVLVVRDFAQRELKHWIWGAMLVGLALSTLTSWITVVVASGLAFLVSETVDWAVYTFTRRPLSQRIMISSMASAPLDQIVFIGLASLVVPGIFAWGTILTGIASKLLGAWIVSKTIAAQERAAVQNEMNPA